MSTSKLSIKSAAGGAALAAAAALTAIPAAANPDIVPFGGSAQLTGADGAEVTGYTVRDLQPSGNNDGVWFSDVTVQADKRADG